MSFSKEETDVEWVGSSIDARRIRSASKYQTHQSHFHCQMPSCPTTFPQQVSHTGKNILEAWKIIEKYWSRKNVDRLIMVNICKSMKFEEPFFVFFFDNVLIFLYHFSRFGNYLQCFYFLVRFVKIISHKRNCTTDLCVPYHIHPILLP